MKSTSFSSLVLCFLFAPVVQSSFAQSTGPWIWQNPLPQGNVLHDIGFTDAARGWAVGEGETAIRTSNGGASWQVVSGGGPQKIVDAHFLDDLNGWAVSEFSNDVLRTTDGGATWTDVETGIEGSWKSIHFADFDHGWLAGSRFRILGRTSDGGQTWSSVMVDSTGWLEDVFFVDTQTGWVVGNLASMYKTTDGGQTWNEQDPDIADTLRSLLSVHFLDDQTGWAVGQGAIATRTTDGGATWTEWGGQAGGWFTDVHFPDAQNGYITTTAQSFEGTIVMISSDGGVNWTPKGTGALGDLNAVHFIDTQTGRVVGDGGQILVTTDGGQTWLPETFGPRDTFQDVVFIDSLVGVAVRATTTTPFSKSPISLESVVDGTGNPVTVDGGTVWTDSDHDVTCSKIVWKIAKSPNFHNNLQFLIDNCGEPYVRAARALQAGPNKRPGAEVEFQWFRIDTGETGEILSIHMPDTLHWWVVGSEGLIRATADSGATWTDQNSGTDEHLSDVFFANINDGWAVGARGGIYHTGDGGQTWAPQVSGTDREFRTVFFLDEDRGFAAGMSRTFVRTADGGETWLPVQVPFASYYDMEFADDLHGLVVGSAGVILETTDGGETWSQLPSPTSNTLIGLSYPDRRHAWMTGTDGTILRYRGGGLMPTAVDPAAPEIPLTSRGAGSLEQNYPNPFNGSTTIRYHLEDAGHVRLEVFDLLGRRVSTLADGNMPAGTYSTTFDDAGLVPGVYVFRLQTEVSRESRRMVLVD